MKMGTDTQSCSSGAPACRPRIQHDYSRSSCQADWIKPGSPKKVKLVQIGTWSHNSLNTLMQTMSHHSQYAK